MPEKFFIFALNEQNLPNVAGLTLIMQWHVEHLAYHSLVSRDQALSFTELKTQTPTPTHQLDNRRIKKTYIFQENTTFSLGNVTYAARAPLFSRKDLQHSFRGHGGAPAGVPTPACIGKVKLAFPKQTKFKTIAIRRLSSSSWVSRRHTETIGVTLGAWTGQKTCRRHPAVTLTLKPSPLTVTPSPCRHSDTDAVTMTKIIS